jgi:hypothetical protein
LIQAVLNLKLKAASKLIDYILENKAASIETFVQAVMSVSKENLNRNFAEKLAKLQ